VRFRKVQSETPDANAVRARLEQAVAAGISIDRVAVASESLSWATVEAFLKAKTKPQARVILGVVHALDKIEGRDPQSEDLPDLVPGFRDRWSKRPAAPRTFATEAERISYALGVLDMAGTSNRLVIETSTEVSRAISAAAAALLAPVSGPKPSASAPTAAGPTRAEKAEKHRTSGPAPAAPAAAPAAAASPPKGRRSAQ
jgi:hypothetical protein